MKTPKGRYPKDDHRYPISEAIERLAPSRATVLLVGASSDTKALVAHALHELSPRALHRFVVVDCSAVSPMVIEETLFGGPSYEVGARSRDAPGGVAAQADRGTLYVARIDVLPVALQPRFLRFLDEVLTVRVVVSADADLAVLAERRLFRTDLGERLSLVRLDLSEASEV